MSNLILWGSLIIPAIIMLAYYSRTKSPVASALKGMLSGAAALIAVCFLGEYVGVSLPLTAFTAAAAIILGIPGVILLVIGSFVL